MRTSFVRVDFPFSNHFCVWKMSGSTFVLVRYTAVVSLILRRQNYHIHTIISDNNTAADRGEKKIWYTKVYTFFFFCFVKPTTVSSDHGYFCLACDKRIKIFIVVRLKNKKKFHSKVYHQSLASYGRRIPAVKYCLKPIRAKVIS